MNGNVDVGRRFFWGVPFKKNWHYALLNFGKFYPESLLSLVVCCLWAWPNTNETTHGPVIYVIVIGFAIASPAR